MAIVLVLLAIALISGGVVTAVGGYSVWSGVALVTIGEPLDVDNITVSSGLYTSEVWTVDMYAGESEWLNIMVTNLASVDIPGTLMSALSSDCGGELSTNWKHLDGVTWVVAPEAFTFDAGTLTDLRLVVNATTSCEEPCSPSVAFDIER